MVESIIEDLNTRWHRMSYERRTLVLLALMAIVAVALFGIGYKLGMLHTKEWALQITRDCVCPNIPYI